MAEEFESQKQPESLSLPYEEQEAAIYENLDWGLAKERLIEGLPLRRFPSDNYPNDTIELLNLALQMRKFDQELFDNDKDLIFITHEEMGEYLIEEINYKIEDLSPSTHPRRLLDLATPTKELHPKRFELEVRMEEKHLENIAELIERYRDNPMLFVHYYQMGLTINAQEIRKRVNIDKSYSDQIRQRAGKDIQKGTGYKSLTIMDAWFWATIDSHKWRELPKITISQEQERIMKQHLETWVSQGACSASIFKWVNALKNKEISIED